MAGYAGTPLPQKLGIQEGHAVAQLGGAHLALALPTGATLRRDLRGTAPLDVILWFVTTRAELETRLAACRERLAENGGLWVAWPKRSSGVATDVHEQVIRDVALPTGLVDNKVCAIDETWSGLRLVIRRELRRAPSPARRRASPRSTGR
jgi:hypothetical protein